MYFPMFLPLTFTLFPQPPLPHSQHSIKPLPFFTILVDPYSWSILYKITPLNEPSTTFPDITSLIPILVRYPSYSHLYFILQLTLYHFPSTLLLLLLVPAKHYLNYIGVIPVMIMEFVDRGSLRNYLNCLNPDKKNSDRLKIKHSCLLYGKQIADGMSYLVSK